MGLATGIGRRCVCYARSMGNQKQPVRPDSLLVLSHVCLIAFLPWPTWEDPIALLRMALGLHITILVWLAGARPRFLPYAVALWLPSSLVLLFVPNMI